MDAVAESVVEWSRGLCKGWHAVVTKNVIVRP
jgi:hypothetical protein